MNAKKKAQRKTLPLTRSQQRNVILEKIYLAFQPELA